MERIGIYRIQLLHIVTVQSWTEVLEYLEHSKASFE